LPLLWGSACEKGLAQWSEGLLRLWRKGYLLWPGRVCFHTSGGKQMSKRYEVQIKLSDERWVASKDYPITGRYRHKSAAMFAIQMWGGPAAYRIVDLKAKEQSK
jgi:hypothetical protein